MLSPFNLLAQVLPHIPEYLAALQSIVSPRIVEDQIFGQVSQQPTRQTVLSAEVVDHKQLAPELLSDLLQNKTFHDSSETTPLHHKMYIWPPKLTGLSTIDLTGVHLTLLA